MVTVTSSYVGNTVQPGDLITAECFNQILIDLQDLNQRVSTLEGNVTAATIHIYRIDGPTPIRVGSRVTVVGDNFSVPGTRNVVTINSKQAAPIDNASTATQIVIDMPDPGIGQTGQLVTLSAMNVARQTASYQFQLEPALVIPTGTLTASYVTSPAGSTVAAGTYDFWFKLIADVDQNSQVHISATSSAADWTSTLIDPLSGNTITQPITLLRSAGTHFELSFLVRVTVPGGSGASPSADISVGATEITPGTHVNPAPMQPLSLAIGQPMPVPEHRVAVDFLSTSSNVTFTGGTAVFTRNTMGRIDFDLTFSNLGTTGGVVTSFSPTFVLNPGDSNVWSTGIQSGKQIDITGPQGKGSTGLRITPPNAASNAVLLLTIIGQPTGGVPVNVTYRIPVTTN